MPNYHYATLPQESVIAAARVCTAPDAYITEEPDITAARDLLAKGYRWVRSEEGFAIFEKRIATITQAP